MIIALCTLAYLTDSSDHCNLVSMMICLTSSNQRKQLLLNSKDITFRTWTLHSIQAFIDFTTLKTRFKIKFQTKVIAVLLTQNARASVPKCQNNWQRRCHSSPCQGEYFAITELNRAIPAILKWCVWHWFGICVVFRDELLKSLISVFVFTQNAIMRTAGFSMLLLIYWVLHNIIIIIIVSANSPLGFLKCWRFLKNDKTIQP